MKLLSVLFGKNGRYSSEPIQNDCDEIIACSRFHELIEMERQRVHRNNRQFSMVLFNFHPTRLGEYSVADMAGRIRKRIRRIDRVGWYDDQFVGVLLPNTSADGAQVVGGLIAKELSSGQGDSVEKFPFQTMSYPVSKDPKP